MTHRNPNAREAEDLLEASMATHLHLDEMHKQPADNRGRIAAANQRLGMSLKMAGARATLAMAEEQRRTRTALDGISTRLGDLVDLLDRALLDAGIVEDAECDKCAGPISTPGLCEACTLNVSGPHEGEDRA